MAFALFEVACHAEALAKAGRSVSMNSASAHYGGDASSNEHLVILSRNRGKRISHRAVDHTN